MRFKSFVNESNMWLPLPGLGLQAKDIRLMNKKEIDINEEDIDTFAQQVRANCHEWLTELGGKVFWRGYEPDEEEDAEKPIVVWTEKDRSPRDTPYDIHTFVDNYLHKRFGWFPRSSGVFCTPSYSVAHNYGRVYAVMPIGKYKYIWATRVSDMTIELNQTMRSWMKVASMKKYDNREIDKEDLSNEDINSVKLRKVLNSFLYTDKGITANHHNEVMVDCDKYLLIPDDMVRHLYEALGMKMK